MSAPPATTPPPPPTEGEVTYLLCRAAECGWRLPYDAAYRPDAENRRALHEQFCAYF